METSKVGFRFCPTEEELINYFLKNMILGKTWLVHDTIREVNFCSYDPASLPALSMIKSKDLEWYFLSPEEYTSPKKKVRKRTTPSGFWKATGKDRDIRKDNRRNGVVIGTKRSLVYHEGKSSSAVWTPWTMHEYNITCLPLVDERTYVICKIFYKGNAGDIPSCRNYSLFINDSNTAGAANTPPQGDQAGEESLPGFSVDDVTMIVEKQEDLCPWDALCSNSNTFLIDNKDNRYVQLQGPYLEQEDIEFLGGMTHVNREHVEFLFIDDQEFITQENSEEYMLQWSLLILAER